VKTSRFSKVLVIDDDTALRIMLRNSLEAEGLAVEEAAGGAEGLERFAEWHPDLVVLDVVMDDMDGFAVCEALRATPAGGHLPIIMLTGLNDVESIQGAYTAGATDFATKPINPMILAHRIRYMLRSSGLTEELRDSRGRLARAQRLARLGDWEWDPGRQRLRLSQVACEVLGLATDCSDQSLDWFVSQVPEGDQKRVQDALRRATVGHEAINLSHPFLRLDGAIRYVQLEASFVVDEASPEGYVIGTLQDISERKAAEERIVSLAYYDGVTGIPNRSFFLDFVRRVRTRTDGEPYRVGVIAIGLDGLHRVTDSWGEAATNSVVRDFVRRIREAIRTGAEPRGWRTPEEWAANASERSDVMVRLSNEDFAVLLLGVGPAPEVEAVGQQLAALLERPFDWRENSVVLTASMGISLCPGDAEDAEALLHNARASMRHAQSVGDPIRIYTREMEREVRDRLEWESDLRQAIDNDELLLNYQPKISAQARLPVGFEALLRWRKPSGELVRPDLFIPLAEQTGLIIPIGQRVLRMACRQGGQWLGEGLAFDSIAVNIAPAQFRHEEFVRSVEAALKEAGLAPQLLELEITEGTLIEDTHHSLDVLRQLSEIGVRIVLDDFGTGYSSLSYLDRFPLESLKIDRSFVADILAKYKTRAIVRCVISLAHELGMTVVAEGVETLEQRELLDDLQCDFFQGFFFSRPLQAADARSWMVQAQRGSGAVPVEP
jgi:PAS domain S-box-containing protein